MTRKISGETVASLKIVFLSDLAVGYGTPQISYFLKSISEYFGTSDICVIEPDQKGRVFIGSEYPFNVIRVSTTYPPYSHAFIPEYNRFIGKYLKINKPKIVIASHGFVLPACLKYKSKSNLLIYYMLESVGHQIEGIGPSAVNINRVALSEADIVLVPELLRAQTDLNVYGWKRADLIETFNAGATYNGHAPQSRNSRILYAGSLGPQTLCDILLSPALSDVQFDVAGPADTQGALAFLEKAAKLKNISYLGLLSADKLDRIRRHYAYSLVMWSPNDVNQLYASPNKFFETIAAGVPPISAPHPQCYKVIKKYGCGILSAGWEEHQMTTAINEAMMLLSDSPGAYAELVENCREAADSELNWDCQFSKIVPSLAAWQQSPP
jgi:glycosyltransferase involved in cell wall biosynthesis